MPLNRSQFGLHISSVQGLKEIKPQIETQRGDSMAGDAIPDRTYSFDLRHPKIREYAVGNEQLEGIGATDATRAGMRMYLTQFNTSQAGQDANVPNGGSIAVKGRQHVVAELPYGASSLNTALNTLGVTQRSPERHAQIKEYRKLHSNYKSQITDGPGVKAEHLLRRQVSRMINNGYRMGPFNIPETTTADAPLSELLKHDYLNTFYNNGINEMKDHQGN